MILKNELIIPFDVISKNNRKFTKESFASYDNKVMPLVTDDEEGTIIGSALVTIQEDRATADITINEDNPVHNLLKETLHNFKFSACGLGDLIDDTVTDYEFESLKIIDKKDWSYNFDEDVRKEKNNG